MSYYAFFDLDKTLLKINSGKVLFPLAYKKGVISFRRYLFANLMAILYKLRIIDSARIIEIFPPWLAGYPEKDFAALCQSLVESELIASIRPQMIEVIKKHKAKGAKLVMLSATIDLICNPLAKHLGFDDIICSELEVLDNQFTGHPKGKLCFRGEKLTRLNIYLQNIEANTDSFYYYGDSMDDLPVLESVAYPVCVNPDAGLKKIAEKRNWAIHQWED